MCILLRRGVCILSFVFPATSAADDNENDEDDDEKEGDDRYEDVYECRV